MQFLQLIYRLALVAVVICVLIVQIAPHIDLPEGTSLRAKHDAHLPICCLELTIALVLLVTKFFVRAVRGPIVTQFDFPTRPSLCIFLC